MAKSKETLRNTIVLREPKTNARTEFLRGTPKADMPKWAVDKITNPQAFVEPPDETETAEAVPPAPPTSGVEVLTSGSQDEIKAWLEDATVDDVKDAVGEIDEDARADVAGALAAFERDRGDKERKTLLEFLDEVAEPEPAEQ